MIHKPNRLSLILATSLLAISFEVYPTWLFDWLEYIDLNNYTGYPLLIVLPLGPLLFLALICYRHKHSRFVVLMAALPQRMVYDQRGVLLVPRTKDS